MAWVSITSSRLIAHRSIADGGKFSERRTAENLKRKLLILSLQQATTITTHQQPYLTLYIL